MNLKEIENSMWEGLEGDEKGEMLQLKHNLKKKK